MTRTTIPLGAVARGLAAGAVGTGVMTAWQQLSAGLQGSGGEAGGPEAPQDPWERAPAPAKVARRIAEGVFHTPIPVARIPLVTNVMHWAYGIGWGSMYGLIAGSRRRSGPADAAGFGIVVWLMSYAQLVPMGLYEPPWRYPPKALALDLSYHLAYAAGVAAAWSALDR